MTQTDVLSTDVLSPRTFCPHGCFVRRTFCLMDVLSPRTFCLTDVLSLWMFCPRTFCPRTFCPRTFCPQTFCPRTFCPRTFCLRTFCLGTVVCLLKLVKGLPGVQNGTPVMNTPGSRLPHGEYTEESQHPCGEHTR
jgi:hypothetical protein